MAHKIHESHTTLDMAFQETLTSGYLDTAAQRRVLKSLSRVADDVLAAKSLSQKTRLLIRKVTFQPEPPHQGLYLWGGVGRGKTFLMDLFFDWVPIEEKRRLHFHRFISFVHHRLTELRGQSNPLLQVAIELSRDIRLLCFDEFFVSDIGDAMILSELLAGLFHQGIYLVATSNIQPDRLYEDGLHRDRFFPAIELIKQYNEILEIAGQIDYRLSALRESELYRLVYPTTYQTIAEDQALLVSHERIRTTPLKILNREIETAFHTDGVVGFRFYDLCETPRSALDYIEIASLFHTLLIYDIPVLTPRLENAARRFIALIDELYDRRVNVLFCAQQSVETLYQGKSLETAFERTRSRIFEMQTEKYLSQGHKP